MSDWIIEKNATCYSEGTKYKKCVICGKRIEEEKIDPFEHSFDNERDEDCNYNCGFTRNVDPVDEDCNEWTSSSLYISSSKLSVMPKTFETNIKVSSINLGRTGVIFGNYGKSMDCVNFEIHEDGRPRLFFTDFNGIVTDVIFNNVKLNDDKWNHLSVVANAKTYKCYVNGKLKSTVFEKENDFIPTNNFCIGGDFRHTNAQYFKGLISDVSIYFKPKSDEEIKEDYEGNKISKNDLAVGYDLSSKQEQYLDLSDNKINLNKSLHLDNVTTDPTDFDYSFTVIGDTQNIVYRKPEQLDTMYDYVVSNIEEKNIKHLFNLGDITENSLDREYLAQIEQYKRLDGKLSYSINRGNHDTPVTFDKYLGLGSTCCDYSSQYDEYYLNAHNSAHKFSVNNLDYLVFTLDYGANDDVLNWASHLIEDYPHHNVVITTHCYLFRDGTTLDVGDVCPPSLDGGTNNGDDIWDKLISKHKNIVLVISGHDPTENAVINQRKGNDENIVTELLIDPQNLDKDDIDAGNEGYGIVVMLYFSNEGRAVDLRYYSTIKRVYINSTNQFSFNLNVIERQ